MPSPDVVRQQIQGSTPVDTLARQVTVLNRLTRIIERMRMAPQRGFNLTPDEKQLSSAYSVASYQLSQSYTKSATPEAVKTFEQMVARYEGDSTLYNQMIGLLSAATLADYRRVDREAGERAQARIDQEAARPNRRARCRQHQHRAGPPWPTILAESRCAGVSSLAAGRRNASARD